MQERKAKSDEGVRKLVEQKQIALNKAVEQINTLKSQIIKSKRASCDISKQSMSTKLNNSSLSNTITSPIESPRVRASTMLRSKSQTPTILWEIDNKVDPDNIQLNTFDFSRKLSKSSLPSVYDLDSMILPNDLFKDIVSTKYLQPLLVSEDLEMAKSTIELYEENNADHLSTGFIHIFEYSDPLLCLELMKYYTRIEIDKTFDVNTLFRGNSFASKILSKYSRIIGTNYLIQVLTPIIDNISPNCNFEVDPDRYEQGITINEEKNQAAVRILTEEFLDGIMNSLSLMPLQMRIFSCFLKESVSEKFPDNANFGVVNFIFLRFFCVALAAPLSFEIKSSHMNEPNVKRGMLLASKLLQTLANGAKLKEKFMIPFNSWLDNTTPKFLHFFDELTNSQPKIQKELFTKPKFTKTKEETTNLLQEIIKTKKQQFLSIIPDKYNIKQEGCVLINVSNLLQLFTDKYLKNEIDGKSFNKENEYLHVFLHFLTCENSFMAAIAEKLDKLLGFRQKEPYIIAFLELFSYVHSTRKLSSLINFWIEIEVDNNGSLEHTMMASRMISKYVQSYTGNMFYLLLFDLIDPLIIHHVSLEIDEDRMTENQLLTCSEDTKALLRICEDIKTEVIARLPKLPV